MKRYLIRAGFNPLRKYTAKDYQLHPLNIIGNNSGNLLFAYGVMNVLSTEDVEFDTFYEIKEKYSDAEIEHINSTYDAFVIPMADAFRPDYMKKLSWYAALMKRLTIPCFVIGIGYRGLYNPDFSAMKEYEMTVKDFCDTVLQHSSVIGLRGSITGDYLSYLGYQEYKHYMVIGCPSLYTYGILPPPIIPDKGCIENGKICVNANNKGPLIYDSSVGESLNGFLRNVMECSTNHYLIQQLTYEFEDIFIGNHSKHRLAHVPYVFSDDMVKELSSQDRIKFFMDVPSWLTFLEDTNLYVGSRFHGVVASILAGVPTVFLPFNARTRELAEYHHLTCITPTELGTKIKILDIIDQLDFLSFHHQQEKNVFRYLDFLHKNGLTSILDEKLSWSRGSSPLERKVAHSSEELHNIESLSGLGKQFRILRWEYNYWMSKVRRKHT